MNTTTGAMGRRRAFEIKLYEHIGLDAYRDRLEDKRSKLRCVELPTKQFKRLKRQVRLIEFIVDEQRIKLAKGDPCPANAT